MTDFVLEAEGGVQIKVVKAFLHSCPYFEAMLENDWAERNMNVI